MQSAQAADITGTKKVVAGILETCFEAGDWKGLNEQIVLLSKRRAQLKQVRYFDLFSSLTPVRKT